MVKKLAVLFENDRSAGFREQQSRYPLIPMKPVKQASIPKNNNNNA
ncbi:hypothetical protein [Pedobacter miscanthi]|nr:hypothetical protein [Pedobacter miscanthi]